jgi:hypothetical protein
MSTPSVPRPVQIHNADHANALSLLACTAVLSGTMPAALVGAGIVSAMWRVTRPDIVTKWVIAGLGAAAIVALQSSLAIAWPLRLLGGLWLPSWSQGLTQHAITQSLPVELLAGPALLIVLQAGLTSWRRTVHGQEWSRYKEMDRRRKALDRKWDGPEGRVNSPPSSTSEGLVLGTDTRSKRPFVIGPAELAQHVFIPGGSGSGKTTTLVRLADGALSVGYGLVIVDCKGSSLGGAARDLASRHGLPFTLVDPHDRKTAGYDPCSGEPAAVANKLIGAFTFSGEAEIYKQVAMEVIPVICRALKASHTPITLDAIYESLNRGGLSRLGRKDGAEEYRTRLEDLEESGGVGAAGYAGLQRRLGALMEGTFHEIFRKRPAINWKRQLGSPHVTYLSLSATAASEDVELFGRVITQDLKQVCDSRMRALKKGEDVTPVLIIYDEFAALREATQIVDLLLQAREAKAPLVIATQIVPDDPAIRKPIMSAGVLIVHRLEAEDAEPIAAQFGTRSSTELTAQMDFETGTSQKGSVRIVEQYNVHPNELKELPVGMAAVYVRPSMRRAFVAVHRTD